jgi:peptide/nickel transport system permease protein
MTRYLAIRIVHSVIVVIGVTIIMFWLEHRLPGGPARAILGAKATPVTIAAFNKEFGLDKPLPVQYLNYVGQLLQGNLGYSYKLNLSVDSLLSLDLPKTFFLVGIAFLISAFIAIPLGIV